MAIDPRSPEFPYRQIAAALESEIESGELGDGAPVPSEKELMERFKVSRGTARAAVRYLRDHGYVHTVPGRGSFVTSPETEDS